MLQWIKSKPWLYKTLMQGHKIYMSVHEMFMHFAWHLFVRFPLNTKKVVFGNFYGGGYNCTPCADVSDGLIDYQIIKKVSVITFAALIGKFKKGLIYGNPKYNRIAKFGKAKKIVVESPKTLTICIDGETIHRNKVTIEVLKHKIRFILPKK